MAWSTCLGVTDGARRNICCAASCGPTSSRSGWFARSRDLPARAIALMSVNHAMFCGHHYFWVFSNSRRTREKKTQNVEPGDGAVRAAGSRRSPSSPSSSQAALSRIGAAFRIRRCASDRCSRAADTFMLATSETSSKNPGKFMEPGHLKARYPGEAGISNVVIPA